MTDAQTDFSGTRYLNASPTLERVLACFEHVKRVGNRWIAHCPIHEDKDASLAISEGTDGRVLVHCFAGCNTEHILRALGLSMCDLFPEKPKKAKAKREIVATYPYTDAQGKLLYETVRYTPKSFAQRRPDGKGGWAWNLDGVPRVLYMLPEVLSAVREGRTVFVVEGEKDADNLAKLGLCATTNSGGAGKWRDEYSEALRSAHVVIIPDKDEPGRRHAERVARSLSGKTTSIKIIELPGPGKDVSNSLAAGYTRKDLEALVAEAPEWEPEPEAASTQNKDLRDTIGTDLTNAERFVNLFGDQVRYVPAWGWLVWDTKRWKRDDTEEVRRLAMEVLKDLYREAAETDDQKRRQALADWAKRSESRQRLEAMIALAEPLCAAHPEDFDIDPWLLNVLNGTVDLRTGELREHRKEDLITKLAPVKFDPGSKAPTWLRFLDRIFARRENLICFVQKTLGYALTSDTREQCLFIMWGSGANGKSTLVNTVSAVLGEYALAMPTETLLAKRQDYIPNDIARLKGGRFVSAVESAEGRKLNEPLIKSFTGGDRIAARFLHREFFEFAPTFKIFIATNHKPVIRGTDHAVWRRIRLIPFTVTIPEAEQDKELPRRLLAEASGILNWLVEGCLAWQRDCLGMPDEVKTATENYRSEMDTLAAFLADCCILDEDARVNASDLYHAFKSWSLENGEDAISQRAFGMALTERGFTRVRGTGGRIAWTGVGLRVNDRVNKDENADQISENTQKVNDSERTFGVFSLYRALPEKTCKLRSLSFTKEGDFADGNDKSERSGESFTSDSDAVPSESLKDNEIPF